MHARWRRATYVQCLQAGKALVAPGTETPAKESNEGEDGMGVTLKRQRPERVSSSLSVSVRSGGRKFLRDVSREMT